jgi:hypothetical protein
VLVMAGALVGVAVTVLQAIKKIRNNPSRGLVTRELEAGVDNLLSTGFILIVQII